MLRIAFDDADGSPLGKVSGANNEEASRGLDRASVVHARRLISAENHLAKNFAGGADLPSIQELFAQEVQSNLEGGRAAILRPSKRRMLIAAGIKAGLRPFQTQLIMAQVQEERRHTSDIAGKREKSKVEGGLEANHEMDTPESLTLGVKKVVAAGEAREEAASSQASETSGGRVDPHALDRAGMLQLAIMIGMTILLAGGVFFILVMWMG